MEGPKRARFDETAVQCLAEFVRAQPGNELPITGIDAFYRAHPEYRGLFKGRLTKVAEQHPNLLRIDKASRTTGDLCIKAVSDEDTTPQPVSSVDQSAILQAGADAFIEFLRNHCENGLLPVAQMDRFYEKHPDFQGMFDDSAKRRLLRRLSKGKLVIEKNEVISTSDTTLVFRLVEDNSVVMPNYASTNEFVEEIHVILPTQLTEEILAKCTSNGHVVMDVDEENAQLYYVALYSGSMLLIIDFRRRPSDISLNIRTLLANESVTKIGFYIGFQIKTLLGSSSDVIVNNVFDLASAYALLANERPLVTSLGDVTEEYGVTVEFQPSLTLRDNAWTRNENNPLPVDYISRLCLSMLRAYERLKEDAYSRSKLEACYVKSRQDLTQTLPLDIAEYRLLKDPTSMKALSRGAIKYPNEVRSFRTKLANTRRCVALKTVGLPLDACFHFHRLTPGSCERGEKCKFRHTLDSS